MATFHDLKHIVKDTIAVDAKQRYTPQEVKFINRNNEFYGTFHGKVDATKLLVSNAELSGCTFFDENGISVDVSKLGKSQEEIKELIKSLDVELHELSTDTKGWIETAVSESSGSVLVGVTSTIETISTRLSNDIDKLETNVAEISAGIDTRVTRNEKDIEVIKEKQIGAISYRGIMRVLNQDTTFHDIFLHNFDDSASTSEDLNAKTLEQGWMWCIQTDDHKKHYPIEGEFLEHGDFIVINQKVTIKDVNKNCVDILDMMDFDLSCDTELDLSSVNPVQNKVIANEIESLKQIMTGIDTKVDYVDGVLSSLPNAEDFTKNQVVTIKSSNGIQADYICCENDDGEKYWKQYVVDGIFERKEFKNQYSDSETKAVEQLSDSNENYPSSRLVKKIYEDLTKSDKELKDALDGEIGERKTYADNISVELSQKIDETKTYLESVDSSNHSELTSLINKEKTDRIASLTTILHEIHLSDDNLMSRIDSVYAELTSNYSTLTSTIDRVEAERIAVENAILTSLNDYMENETRERSESDTNISNLLTTKIDTETTNRLTSYNELSEKLNSESTERTKTDAELSNKLIFEIENRVSCENALQDKIDTEETNREQADERLLTSFNSRLDFEIASINDQTKNLSTELTAQIHCVDSQLLYYNKQINDALEGEKIDRINTDNKLSSELTSYISENNDRVKTIEDGFETYKKANDNIVKCIEDNVDSLCATTKTEVNNIKQTLVGSVKYMGHITLKESDSALSIWQIFENYLSNELTSMTTLSNGWMYTVTFDETMPSSIVELSTADKVVLTPKDYIIIDNHDPDSGGVDISAISRETIDIIDVVDDVYVKRSEYEQAKTDLSNYVDSKTSDVSSEAKQDNEILFTNITAYIDTKINELDYDNVISNDKSQLITTLAQTDGKISYTTKDLDIADIQDLQRTLDDNATSIKKVGTTVDGMNNTLTTLYSDISNCFYFDDNGLKRQKTIDEIDFEDTIKVCFHLMKNLDNMFNPMGSINMYESHDEALPVMDKKFY